MWHRKPVVAGSFYPSDTEDLKRDIDSYINKASDKEVHGEIIGVICPHAGYIYSGPIAAHSYKKLIGSGVELVIVLAPSHRVRFNGASVIDSGVYETPLGEVEIDSTIGQSLLEHGNFSFIKEAHSAEHSLEVQVPFLQKVLKDFKIVPIILGGYDINSSRAIAEGLYDSIKNDKRKSAVVISTDLSHYHSYDTARKLDGIYIKALESADENKLEESIYMDSAEACGHGPVMTGLVLCKKLGASRVEVLHYANSGDTAGGKNEVVGYLSAAILK